MAAMWRGLRRLPGLTLGLAAPGVIAIGAMMGFGAINTVTGMLAFLAIIIIAAVIATPWALSMGSLRDAIDRLGPDFAAGPEPSLPRWVREFAPTVDALWAPLSRLGRAWRNQFNTLSGRLEATEAVIAAG